MKTSTKVLIAVISVILIGVIVWVIVYASTGYKEKTYTELVKDINNESVVEIYLENDTAYVKTDSSGNKVAYKVFARDTLIIEVVTKYNEDSDHPDRKDIVLSFNDRYATSITDYIIPVLGLLMLVVLMIFMFRAMSNSTKSTMDFGKTKANMQNQLKVRFSDVAGAEEEKEELKEIVEFLKNPQKFTAVGARVPHGVLLVGPPGTGKTLFAKAVAGEANVPFFSKSGSDFVEMFVGVGASRVRDLFDQAKKNMPCIVFIDEIDAVGRQRGAGMGGGNDEREQTLNQLLVAMDGFESNEHIIVMAATNRSDVLDPALMRPGRFDRQIYVNLPDVRGREAILKVHARNKPLASDVDFQAIARITSGFSGADIENLLNEAAILAARDNRTRITMEDMFEGIDKVVMGPQKKSRLVTPVDQRITAYHEAGHAIVARRTKGCDPVQEVSIIPRGQAAGYTMYRPDNDNNHISHSKVLGMLAQAMGGRAAEELVIEDYTAGGRRPATGDKRRAQNGHRVGHVGQSRSRVLRRQSRGVPRQGLSDPAFLLGSSRVADRRGGQAIVRRGARQGGQDFDREPQDHGEHGARAVGVRNHLFRRSRYANGRRVARRSQKSACRAIELQSRAQERHGKSAYQKAVRLSAYNRAGKAELRL